ncbi:methylcrotonoyl-CoA carboxylase subunit alpha, mitochondrial [Elysia marginata]|uniref:Methylcrotonoyl-CoA carboxylase subunit alpha, mitochondrial n=1 Tax=Elysia marginata TaxID=1093978 RepID=A0AAV4GZ14_9GAST|nr:methylcrotonoyl-CoA carboxylase subunit alpha, mitochondrial [Elysia marginata]
MRTAKRLGIRSVAVYSEADRHSLHVAMADEAYHIGPATASESYLRQDKILEVAKKSGAQAIHPGYGFLSENVEFAEACERENITFVGPPASAIRDMGIKSTSKHIMSAAGVPIIEGYHGEDQSDEKLRSEAQRIGYPIMIKAVRGGGGKGMRIAMTEAEFDAQLESAKTEAMKAFGDQVMLLEKYVVKPRHVEVQVFGDRHGNHVYLFERDCSVQRRHQKIIEEAPAPGLTEEVRRSIGEAAVRAAKAVDYVGAGDEVSVHYDPMIAKLVVWSDNRSSALQRTLAALRDYHVVGLSTNIRFLMALASHQAFRAADVNTDFIPNHQSELFPPRSLSTDVLCQAALAMVASLNAKNGSRSAAKKDVFSPFAHNSGMRINDSPSYSVKLADGDTVHTINITETGPSSRSVCVDGQAPVVIEDVRLMAQGDAGSDNEKTVVRCSVNGQVSSSTVLMRKNSVHVFAVDGSHNLSIPLPNFLKSSLGAGSIDDPVAPMPGVVERVTIEPGSEVKKGDPLVVMIAMKMEYVIRAARDGVVEKVYHKPGDTVAKGTVLVHLQEEN